ncbi:hypothetical protein D3C80_1986590 [compost metagenome]
MEYTPFIPYCIEELGKTVPDIVIVNALPEKHCAAGVPTVGAGSLTTDTGMF